MTAPCTNCRGLYCPDYGCATFNPEIAHTYSEAVIALSPRGVSADSHEHPRYWLHAFCLDEEKYLDGDTEQFLGPFEWIGITWEYVRARSSDGDGGPPDHQFMYDMNTGYWHPTHGSMTPDYTRRYSDIGTTLKGPSA